MYICASVSFVSRPLMTSFHRNVLGGNFALVGLPSVGASGAIFGTVGVLWVDLLAHWGIERTPGKKVCGISFFRVGLPAVLSH